MATFKLSEENTVRIDIDGFESFTLPLLGSLTPAETKQYDKDERKGEMNKFFDKYLPDDLKKVFRNEDYLNLKKVWLEESQKYLLAKPGE